MKVLVESGEKNLAVNIAQVPIMDSSCIGAIGRKQKSLKEMGGRLTLFAPTKILRQTLKIVGFDKLLDIRTDEARALAS